MKLKYNILWLDDQIDEFIEDGFVNQLAQYLEEEGFEPNIEPISNVVDFFSKLSDSWDLILTDYNMSGKNGAQVIAEVRSQLIYTEILFYTAQQQWEDTGKIDRISFVQTVGDVSGTHHEIVTREAKRLISLMVKKFHDIVVMRGMIMHETSFLDAQINSLVQAYLECGSKGNCEECDNKGMCTPIIDVVVPQMESQFEEKLKLIKKRNFKKIRKDNFLYSADYKRIILGELLKKHGLYDFSSEYRDDILSVRNKFAHAILLFDEHGQLYFENKAEHLKFDDALCRKIRKDIRKYKELIDEAERVILSKN